MEDLMLDPVNLIHMIGSQIQFCCYISHTNTSAVLNYLLITLIHYSRLQL